MGLVSTSIVFVEAHIFVLHPPNRLRQINRKQIFRVDHRFARRLSWSDVLDCSMVVVGLSLLLDFVMC